jgi:hypothetical protein
VVVESQKKIFFFVVVFGEKKKQIFCVFFLVFVERRKDFFKITEHKNLLMVDFCSVVLRRRVVTLSLSTGAAACPSWT